MRKIKRLKIPQFAKRAACNALKLRKALSKSKKFGTEPTKARKQCVISGVNQAKFLINNNSMAYNKAMQYYRFYQRFKNCRTKKCEGAMMLWGGRKFLKNNIFRFIKRKITQIPSHKKGISLRKII